jgi:hypothetical protein
MKTMKRKSIAAVSAAIMMAGISAGTEESQLKLRDKTITIYPVMLRQLNKTNSSTEAWDSGPRIAESLGISLERWGMLPRIAEKEYPAGIMEEDLIASVKNTDTSEGTDYALILLFEVREAAGKPAVRAQAVMTDAYEKVVWSQRPGEFAPAGNMWPIALYHQIGEQLLSGSDLEKPNTEPEPGPLETRARKRYENSMREPKNRQNTEERS